MTSFAEALREGARLCDAGDPWHAHEVWEHAWRADPSLHRDAWKALIQVAAALYHRQRHHPAPVPALLARARAHAVAHGHHLLTKPQVLVDAIDQMADPQGEVCWFEVVAESPLSDV